MENAEKIEKYDFRLQKGVKTNVDNRNEIFTGDLYNDFMIHFCAQAYLEDRFMQNGFSLLFWTEKVKNTVFSYKKGSKSEF